MIYFFIIRTAIESLAILNFSFRCLAAFGNYGFKANSIIIVITVLLFSLMYKGWPEPIFNWSLLVWSTVLGALLFFLLLSVSSDVLRLLIGIVGEIKDKNCWHVITARNSMPYLLAGTLLLSGYAYYVANEPVIKHFSIVSPKLNNRNISKIRVVQLSDVHLGRLIKEKELEKMLKLVREAQPDIFVVTGDLVDDDMSLRQKEAQMFQNVKADCGKFAVTGNHEWYMGEENSVNFIEASSLKLLRGEAEQTPCGIIVAGIDDELFNKNKLGAYEKLSRLKSSSEFVLLLKHRPNPAPGTEGLFDLQLSGHTHGGQIWPAHFVAKLNYKHLYGLYNLPDGAYLYTSSGSGFWGIPMRLFSRSEVVVIDLVPQNKGD